MKKIVKKSKYWKERFSNYKNDYQNKINEKWRKNHENATYPINRLVKKSKYWKKKFSDYKDDYQNKVNERWRVNYNNHKMWGGNIMKKFIEKPKKTNREILNDLNNFSGQTIANTVLNQKNAFSPSEILQNLKDFNKRQKPIEKTINKTNENYEPMHEEVANLLLSNPVILFFI